jgi:hypothetical protein
MLQGARGLIYSCFTRTLLNFAHTLTHTYTATGATGEGGEDP